MSGGTIFSTPWPLRRFATTTAVAALSFVTLAGCADATAATGPAHEYAGADISVATRAPMVIDNCGTEIPVTTPPQRVITIKSSTLELLLALDLEDRIIGSAYGDGPLSDAYADAGADIPVISPKLPSQEAALALEPDFIFGGWESNFSVDGVGERDTLHTLGIATYVANAACKAAGYMPNPLTFDIVFEGFEEAGQIFGVTEAAKKLVADQRSELAGLTPDDRGLTAVWYSSGRDEPYVGAGIGAPAMLMQEAGLVNEFADIENTWISASWEKVADLNPDVLVLIDSPGNTVQDKIDLLTSNPITSTMDAVINQRFISLEFPEAEAGVRNVTSVAKLITQLGAL